MANNPVSSPVIKEVVALYNTVHRDLEWDPSATSNNDDSTLAQYYYIQKPLPVEHIIFERATRHPCTHVRYRVTYKLGIPEDPEFFEDVICRIDCHRNEEITALELDSADGETDDVKVMPWAQEMQFGFRFLDVLDDEGHRFLTWEKDLATEDELMDHPKLVREIAKLGFEPLSEGEMARLGIKKGMDKDMEEGIGGEMEGGEVPKLESPSDAEEDGLGEKTDWSHLSSPSDSREE